MRCDITLYVHVSRSADIDECKPKPCLNGATCQDKVNGYKCECAPGYTGTNCQTGRDDHQLEVTDSAEIRLKSASAQWAIFSNSISKHMVLLLKMITILCWDNSNCIYINKDLSHWFSWPVTLILWCCDHVFRRCVSPPACRYRRVFVHPVCEWTVSGPRQWLPV